MLGAPVEIVTGDSGDTSTNIATQTVASHQQAGVNAIIGAASSDVTKTVIDSVTQAGILMFSPANTSNDFTTYRTTVCTSGPRRRTSCRVRSSPT